MQLLTESIKAKLPPLYSQKFVKDPMARVKYFHPSWNWTWYAVEFSPDEGLFYGLVCGHEDELGYFSLAELDSIEVCHLKVERNLHWEPRPLSRCKGT